MDIAVAGRQQGVGDVQRLFGQLGAVERDE
jgi:hypothetical protein